MNTRILVLGLFFSIFLFAGNAWSRNCTDDSECKKKQHCHAGRCVKLSPKESLLEVTLEEWVPNAVFFLDGIPMGDVPWEGIVSAGKHTIRVEAPN